MDDPNQKEDVIDKISLYNKYQYFIKQATKALEMRYYQEAEAYIIKAITVNYNAPEAHNLFGALNEYKGDLGHASKHYLAANALDPTYLPAIRNLRRLTTYSFRKKPIDPDLGQGMNLNLEE